MPVVMFCCCCCSNGVVVDVGVDEVVVIVSIRATVVAATDHIS